LGPKKKNGVNMKKARKRVPSQNVGRGLLKHVRGNTWGKSGESETPRKGGGSRGRGTGEISRNAVQWLRVTKKTLARGECVGISWRQKKVPRQIGCPGKKVVGTRRIWHNPLRGKGDVKNGGGTVSWKWGGGITVLCQGVLKSHPSARAGKNDGCPTRGKANLTKKILLLKTNKKQVMPWGPWGWQKNSPDEKGKIPFRS